MVIGIRRLILLFKVEKTELFKENLCDEKEKRNFNISHNRHPCHLGRNWFCREKAYDRHQEELRLQAIETKNSEIDAEYQKFENEENRDKKLEALKQEVESAVKYEKTEDAYEECSAHYEKSLRR